MIESKNEMKSYVHTSMFMVNTVVVLTLYQKFTEVVIPPFIADST